MKKSENQMIRVRLSKACAMSLKIKCIENNLTIQKVLESAVMEFLKMKEKRQGITDREKT